MPRLLIENGPQKGKYTGVTREKVIRVGRGAGVDLQLTDMMTSRNHFEITSKGGVYYLRDLSSTNGTFVNGDRATGQRVLRIGDRIQAGETIISFLQVAGDQYKDAISGSSIAGYEIIERIGCGRTGTVYKAVQLSLDRLIALKIIAKELAQDKQFIEAFMGDVRNAGQLNHPNIVQVYDVGVQGDIHYFSMEYMGRGSIGELLARQRVIVPARAIDMAIDACRGLEYAEKKRIIHSDIKPDNLMMGEDGRVKIADLGIAKRAYRAGGISWEGASGSPHYIAPEQAQGFAADRRTDVYSLGAALYHMVSGRTLFTGKTPQEIIRKVISEAPRSLREVAPKVPVSLCRVIEKAIAKDPARRHQSASALLEELQPLRRARASLKVPVRPVERAEERKRKFLSPAVIIVLVTVVVAIVCYLGFGGSGQSAAMKEEANRILRQAHEFLANKEFDRAEEHFRRVQRECSDLEDACSQADEGLFLVERGREEERWRRQEADNSLREAREFQRNSPDELEKAREKYLAISRLYPDTEAAGAALTESNRIDDALARLKTIENMAEREYEERVSTASSLISRRQFGRALAELESFPAQYAQTPAAEKIEKEKQRIILLAENALAEVIQEAEVLKGEGKYESAKRLLVRTDEQFSVPVVSERISTEIAELEKAIEERERKEYETNLSKDQEALAKSIEEARNYVLEHRYDSAENAYRSLLPLLCTQEFRAKAQEKGKDVCRIRGLHSQLIAQINSGKLQKKIELSVGNLKVIVTKATETNVTMKYETQPEAEGEKSWRSFSAEEMASMYSCMTLDAEGLISAAIFCIEFGLKEQAEEHLQEALKLDPDKKEMIDKLLEKAQ